MLLRLLPFALLLLCPPLHSQKISGMAEATAAPLLELEKHGTIEGLCKGPGNTVQLLLRVPSGRRDDDPDWKWETWETAGLQKTGTLNLETPQWEGEPLRYFDHKQRKDGTVCFFWTLVDRKKHKHYLFSSFYDAAGRVSRLRLIDELTMKDRYAGEFSVCHSDDYSKWVVMAGFRTFSRSQRSALVLDSSFNQLQRHDVALPFPADEAIMDTFAIDNEGRVLVFVSADLEEKSKKEESLRQAVLVFGPGSGQPAVISVGAPGKLLWSVLFDFPEAGRATLFGTYTGIEEKKDFFNDVGMASFGTFSCALDLAANTAGEVRCTPFQPQFRDYFFTRKLKSAGEGLVGPVPKKVVRTNDGLRRVLVQSGGVSTYTGGNKWRTRYTSGPLIAVMYDKTGKHMTEELLHKAIASSDRGGGIGQVYFEDGERLYVLYNDAAKNRGAAKAADLDYGEAPESSYMGVNKDTEVWLARLDAGGSFVRQCLFEVSRDKLYMNSLLSVRTGAREAVFLMGYGEKYRLVRVGY